MNEWAILVVCHHHLINMLSSWLIKTGIVGLCLLQAAMCADIAIQVGQDMTGQSVLQFYPNTTTAKQGDNVRVCSCIQGQSDEC